MEDNSVIILPDGVEIPEGAKDNAEIIGYLQSDGSLKVAFSRSEGPDSFDNMSELFRYAANLRKDV